MELQFDRVVRDSTPASEPSKVAVACSGCSTSIKTEYYDINGNTFCDGCRQAIESAAQTPTGIGPLLRAGVFGLGAGLVGAVIYYAVIAIANLEIGIIAILIGYMVGHAVRQGARGRGGLRFQVLAVALTYASVAFAYTPLAFAKDNDDKGDAKNAPSAVVSSQESSVTDTTARAADSPPPKGSFIAALAFLLIFTMALPLLVVVGSFPSGLISAFIIFLGMSQAWKMTRAPLFQVLGPYRVGAKAV